jgi:hypothetical protein
MLNPSIHLLPTRTMQGSQKVFFPFCPNLPLQHKPNKISHERDLALSSWARPMFQCIPEGERLLQAVALGCHSELEISIQRGFGSGWKRYGVGGGVMLDPIGVPGLAIPVTQSGMLYCVCANTLLLQNGGIRAEGLTLLPQGEEFLLLSLYSFGIFPDGDDETIESIADRAIMRMKSSLDKEKRSKLMDSLLGALSFHLSAIELGESLEFPPQKIIELLAIFDSIHGRALRPWVMDAEPFLAENLKKHRRRRGGSQFCRLHSQQAKTGKELDAKSDSETSKTMKTMMNLFRPLPKTELFREQMQLGMRTLLT